MNSSSNGSRLEQFAAFRRNETGSFDLSKISSGEPALIGKWIERLVRGDDPSGAAGPGSERPINAVVDLFAAAEDSSELRSLIQSAVETLVRRHLESMDLDTESTFDLLDTVEKINCRSAFDHVHDSALNRTHRGRLAYQQLDLHEKTLLTLGSFGRQLSEEFWLREMENPSYARAAWQGLFTMDPHRAIGYLPFLVKAGGERDDAVNDLMFPLFLIMDELERSEALAALGRVCATNEEQVRNQIVSALRNLDVTDLEISKATASVAIAEALSERVASRDDKPIAALESFTLILSGERSEEPVTLVVLEEAFLRYNRFWGFFPTLDASAQALRCARTVTQNSEWITVRTKDALEFITRCLSSRGFAISPQGIASPSLYATLCGFGAIKALANIDPDEPLYDHVDRVSKLAGDAFFSRLSESGARLLADCTRDGLLMDSPNDAHATVHALDFGLSILWNLDLDPAEFGINEKSVGAFLSRCWKPSPGGGHGFTANPDSGSSRPCTTTTAMALRAFTREEWKPFPFDTEEILNFLFRMFSEEGGFRVFPGQPSTLSATCFTLDALRTLGKLDEFLASHRPRIIEFIGACRRDGGFAFNHSGSYSPNVHSVRYALQTCKRASYQLDHPEDILVFLEQVYDPDTGGFYGYVPAHHAKKVAA